jgi:hypothetical protein
VHSLTNSNEAWHEQRATWLETARRRPAMFIGATETAHRLAVREPLRLVWEAKAFRKPTSAFVLLSPTQYVVRCYTGPLVRPIQQMFSWGDKPVLDEGWQETHDRIVDERTYRILNDLPRLRGWRDRFGSATGPRLSSPMFPLWLAQRFAIGYRVDIGMWCQTFENGWPQSEPRLLTVPSPVGLLAAAQLDAQWFPGLPFNEKDVALLATMPHVTVEWHTSDDLLSDIPLSVETVRGWLQV